MLEWSSFSDDILNGLKHAGFPEHEVEKKNKIIKFLKTNTTAKKKITSTVLKKVLLELGLAEAFASPLAVALAAFLAPEEVLL